MKTLFLVLTFLYSGIALAKGHASFKVFKEYREDKLQYDLGLGVYEFIPHTGQKLAYVSWSGCGFYPNPEFRDYGWFKTEQGLELSFSRFSVGSGVHYFRTPAVGESSFSYYGSLSAKLWD